jgi:hypothetical protein
VLNCEVCGGYGWVCEEHGQNHACTSPGMPCKCSPLYKGESAVKFFKPEDFAVQYPDEPLSEIEAAAIANRILEERSKKECEHEQYSSFQQRQGYLTEMEAECKHCGVKLKAKWSPADE